MKTIIVFDELNINGKTFNTQQKKYPIYLNSFSRNVQIEKFPTSKSIFPNGYFAEFAKFTLNAQWPVN